MIKEILVYPKDRKILTQKSLDVEDISEVQEVIQDMKDTLHNTENGVGISAVQIGVLKRICVINFNNKDIVMINPVITRTRGEINSVEGCLSFPEVYGTFKRFEKVWCTYTDENGKEKEIAEGGFMSTVIQHELEHFEGWCKVFDLKENR